jgi:hypothetical protein
MRIWHGYTVGIKDAMCLKYFLRNYLENQKQTKKIEKNPNKL